MCVRFACSAVALQRTADVMLHSLTFGSRNLAANLAVWTTEYCLNFMESWCVGMGGTLKKDRLNAKICDVPCEWINSQVNAEVDAGISTSTACSTDANCAADFLNPLDQSVESPFVAKFQEAVDGWCCSRLKKDTNEMCSGVSGKKKFCTL